MAEWKKKIPQIAAQVCIFVQMYLTRSNSFADSRCPIPHTCCNSIRSISQTAPRDMGGPRGVASREGCRDRYAVSITTCSAGMNSPHSRRLDRAESFFVGDAAGRSWDHSCVDRLFALNASIKFFTPEVCRMLSTPTPLYITDAHVG